VPAAIPDRYALEVRLGRDGDIEEWLATDTSLDRPVLIRSLGPESSVERRREFVAYVTAAARTTHSHLARIFAVSEVEGGAYAVSEWTGGATVADRVAAGQPVELADFLPNASGLAGALAALHSAGAVHGRIDTSAISYSGAHPAKLGAFGREPGWIDPEGDVRALCAGLETALTGSPPGGPPPSERVDGVPRALDTILRAGQSGQLSADDLEKALRAAPTPRAPASDTSPTSRRLLITALGLVLVAVALVAVGAFLSGGTVLVVPTPTTGAAIPTTTPPDVPTTLPTGLVIALEVSTVDPFGEGGENDQIVGNLIDGDPSTEWRTERYLDPLPLLKPGVGVSVRVAGRPARLRLIGLSEGTVFDLRWADQPKPDPEDWEHIAGATASPGSTTVGLPSRADGYWLIWLTDLPQRADGTFQAAIAELRFEP
jgi:putative peptidoglycan lipid II flippase